MKNIKKILLLTVVALCAGLSAQTNKEKVKSAWEVRKTENEKYTTYTFILKGSDVPFLFVGYDKYENFVNSNVKAGVHWPGSSYSGSYTQGDYNFKGDDGNIINKGFGYSIWSSDTGWKNGKEQFCFSYNKNESARFFVELFEKNKFIALQHRDQNFRFKTEGFWQTVEEQGLTKEEIMEAIANEEF